MMGVQPSMVTHWKVVSMASMMLSKLVIPWFGPVHFSRQIDSLFLVRAMVWTMQLVYHRFFISVVKKVLIIFIYTHHITHIVAGFAIFCH